MNGILITLATRGAPRTRSGHVWRGPGYASRSLPEGNLKGCFAHLVSGLPIAHGAQELRLALGDPVLAGAHSLLGEYGARRVVPPAPTTSAVGPKE